MMNKENETLAAQVLHASKLAEARNGACEVVRNETQGLRNQLGALERAREGGGMTPAQVNVAQHNLLAVALARFQAIERAPENTLHNLLNPQPSPVARSLEAQAADVIAEIEAAGAVLHASADGSLEIRNAGRLSEHLRERATGLRAEVAAMLRRDVLIIPAPKHRAGVTA